MITRRKPRRVSAMITLDDFRKTLDDDYVAGQKEGQGSDILIIDQGAGYKWYIWDGYRFVSQSLMRHETAQAALDDLLACDNPVAVRALKEVFGTKYKEPIA